MTTQTPRVIAFEDIREGDRIEAAWSVGDREEAYRGVAAYTSTAGAWCTEEGMLLAPRVAVDTITLLHRPTVTEPKGLGAVVRARIDPRIAPREVRPLVRTAGRNLPWVDERGRTWAWSNLDPDSIEVLSEGIEVDQ